jgi:hypothetical protein
MYNHPGVPLQLDKFKKKYYCYREVLLLDRANANYRYRWINVSPWDGGVTEYPPP